MLALDKIISEGEMMQGKKDMTKQDLKTYVGKLKLKTLGHRQELESRRTEPEVAGEIKALVWTLHILNDLERKIRP